jgi:hypothetical protein
MGVGDSVDAQGKVKARAWCEAIVQRIQEPITPDEFDLDPDPDLEANPTAAFGRKFKIQSFRWLNPDEV